MTGWTVTFDASPEGKAKRGGVGGWVHHIARDIDEENGCQVQHSNENIVPERTHLNETLMWSESGWVKPQTTRQIIDLINEKVDEATEARRRNGFTGLHKNAVVLRGLILQLDPNWIEQNNPDWRVNGLNARTRELHEVMVDFVQEEFAGAFFPCRSTHMDETTVQIQLGMMPTREDGSLDQKFYFKGPTHMKALHSKLRARLREHGYEATFAVSARSTEHLNSKDYGLAMDKAREMTEKAEQEREAAAEDRRAAAADRLLAADELRKVKSRTEDLDARERDVEFRLREVEAAEDSIEYSWEQIRLRDEESRKRREELEERELERQAEFAREMAEVRTMQDRFYDMINEARELRSKLRFRVTKLRDLITRAGLREDQLDLADQAAKLAATTLEETQAKAQALEAVTRGPELPLT